MVLKPVAYLTGTLVIWGMPAVALIVGAVFGKEVLSLAFPETDPETLAALCAFLLFASSFFFAKHWSKKAERKSEYRPVIEEIIEDETP